MKIINITVVIFLIAVSFAILTAGSIDSPSTHRMQLPSELTTGTDMACEDAVFYVDAIFEADPSIQYIRFAARML